MAFAFRNLDLYQDIRRYVREMYRYAALYPKEEIYGLRSQLTRAATSVLLNFSEGMMSPSAPERRRFLQIAINSVGEIVAIADLSHDLTFFSSSVHQEVLIQSEIIVKRLYGLKRKA